MKFTDNIFFQQNQCFQSLNYKHLQAEKLFQRKAAK